jgi:DNA-binding NarL/FixJ family response regulator
MSKKGPSKKKFSEASAYKLNILVLDSDKKSRNFIVDLISEMLADAVVDEASAAAKAVTALSKKRYTFFFVGFRFSDHAELNAIRTAKNNLHVSHICVVSEASDEKSVFQAITNGASSYIWKSDSVSEIRRLVAISLEGGAAISDVITSTLIACLHKNSAVDPPVMSKLTPKESHIINLAAKGHNFKEISSLMDLKMSTIYTHVRHIYEKLQVTSLTQALNVARVQGLIRAPFSRQ